jgi:hypothetical protein
MIWGLILVCKSIKFLQCVNRPRFLSFEFFFCTPLHKTNLLIFNVSLILKIKLFFFIFFYMLFYFLLSHFFPFLFNNDGKIYDNIKSISQWQDQRIDLQRHLGLQFVPTPFMGTLHMGQVVFPCKQGRQNCSCSQLYYTYKQKTLHFELIKFRKYKGKIYILCP